MVASPVPACSAVSLPQGQSQTSSPVSGPDPPAVVCNWHHWSFRRRWHWPASCSVLPSPWWPAGWRILMQSDTHDKTRQCQGIEHTGYSLIQHKMVDCFTEKVRNQSIFFPGFFYGNIFFLKCIDYLRTANTLYRFIKLLAYIGKQTNKSGQNIRTS